MKKIEFEFNLSVPIKHHKGGESVDCSKLILRAPSANDRRQTTRLKQLFMRAIQSTQKNFADQQPIKQKKEQTKLDGVSVTGLLLMSDIDLMECYDQLKIILLNNCAFIENEKPITEFHFNQLADDDLELLLGEYIANFLIPSWMEKMMNQ